MLVAVRDSICSQRKEVAAAIVDTDNADGSVDYLWVKLRNYQNNKRMLYIGVFYFRPNASVST